GPTASEGPRTTCWSRSAAGRRGPEAGTGKSAPRRSMRTMGSHRAISDPSGSAVPEGGVATVEPGAGTLAGRRRRRPFGRAVYVAFLLAFAALAIWLATIEIEGALEDFVLRFGYVGYLGAACIAGINV